MPCCDANGLLPGRGAPPGRGACGVGAAEDPASAGPLSDAGALGLVGAAGAADAADAGATVSSAGFGPGRGPGVAAPGVAAGRDAERPDAAPGRGAGRAPAVPEGAAGPLDADAPAAWPSNAARSLRATGGSIVEEGLLTNSPSSFSFARATLLSMPSSDAISCTRGFATVLLSGARPDRGGPLVADGSHFEPFTLCPLPFSRFSFSRFVSACESRGPWARSARTKARRFSAASTHSPVGCTHAPRPGIDALSSQTSEDSMATTRRSADRAERVRHPTHVRTASILHLPSRASPRRAMPDQDSSRMLSGWMSILAPVSFAARRAFCPSLPMARDSW